MKLPERSKFDINWLAAKPRVIDRIRSQVHPTSVKVIEEYVTPAAAKEAGGAAVAASSAPVVEGPSDATAPAEPKPREAKHAKASAKHEAPARPTEGTP